VARAADHGISIGQIDSRAMSAIDDPVSRVPGRNCGSCALCCKLIGFAEINKPRGQWCPHCLKSRGCGIYESRPNECRDFDCLWLTNANFGEEWEPTRSKMVICHMREGDMSKLVFHVDPGSPLAWKSEPYYSQLKRLAGNGLEHNGIITVNVGKRVFVILPNTDVDFGICDVDDKIALQKKWNGMEWEVGLYKGSKSESIA
jgi:hypothetical protein